MKAELNLTQEELFAKHCTIKHLSFVSKASIGETIEKLAKFENTAVIEKLSEINAIVDGVLAEIVQKQSFTLQDLIDYINAIRGCRSSIGRIILDIAGIKTEDEGIGLAVIDELLYVNGHLYASEIHLIELLIKLIKNKLKEE